MYFSIMSYYFRRRRNSAATLSRIMGFVLLSRGQASVRNRRFSLWRLPLRLLSILLLLGGSGGALADTYDAATNVLTIPLVTVGNTSYTNVRITVGAVISLGGGTANTYDTYDAATNQLTIASVTVGATTYTNVVITVASLISIGGSTLVPTAAPLLVLVNPLAAATVGQAYSANVVAGIVPSSNYTYMMDTLANGVLPTGMTLHIDGTLSGTPFATGRTDVNGNQLPNTYTFGVCAVDTLSRVSTNPCPQTSITVNPATASGPLTVNPASVQMTAPVCFNAPCTISTTVTVTSTTGWDVLVSSFPEAFTPSFSPRSAGPGTTLVTISYRSYGVSSPCTGSLLTDGGFMRFTNVLRTNPPYTTIEVPVTVTLSRFCP